ncbi:hypothetical protein HanPI659440_Chr12g0473821 [Helianthus annuus]|nr:hypothetical protein HanPI659440_Chr12g0473821 [Helianthus annuus]
MDLPPDELQFLSATDILKESISIPKQSPRTFYLITLTLIFPLSFAILAHSLFTHPLITQIQDPYGSHTSQWTKLLIFQFCYLIFLFIFSLLSTAAVVFTVASLYTSKPVVVFLGFVVLLIIAIDTQNVVLFFFSLIVVFVLFLIVHVYITALWHLASVVSVVEPVYGFAAMRKSFEILKGRARMASVLVFGYFVICGAINGLFGAIVVHGGEYDYGVFSRIVVGGFLVGVLVIVNLVGFLVQSVFYYVCKSYHHQGIDKNALYDHLGGYLGEYVPLKSSIQMEDLE